MKTLKCCIVPALFLALFSMGTMGCGGGGGDDGTASIPGSTPPTTEQSPGAPPGATDTDLSSQETDGIDAEEARAVDGAYDIFKEHYVYRERVRPPLAGETLKGYVESYRSVNDIYTRYLDENDVVNVDDHLITDETLIVRTYSPGILYIAFDKFANNTTQRVIDVVNVHVDNGFDKLILDMRVNSGGLVDEAVSLLDYFTVREPGTLLCSIRGPSLSQDYLLSALTPDTAAKEATFDVSNMMVLTSSYTASAAEILVAGLVDFSEADQVGSTTFGKNRVIDYWYHVRGDGFQLTTAIVYHSDGFDREGYGIIPVQPNTTTEPFLVAASRLGSTDLDPLQVDWEIPDAAYTNLYVQSHWRDRVYYTSTMATASTLQHLAW